MNRKHLAIAATLSLSMAAGALFATRAHAQIDPMRQSFGVYERGELVGEIFREDRDPAHYTEHWILYPGYVNPNAENELTLTIRPSGREYENLGDFFRRVPWERGSRHVESICDDGTSLPLRR